MAASTQYWLVKTEPDVFSIDDLAAAPGKTTYWDGVRNYQARNTLRDLMKKGDLVLIYHSNADPLAIVGVAKVVREGYPDYTAWEVGNPHFDAGSTAENPRWYMVDLKLVKKFKRPLTLMELRGEPDLKSLTLLQKGQRLSVLPVRPNEYHLIIQLASQRPT
jgi:predicted RNA-binding protein with PUA-like domain